MPTLPQTSVIFFALLIGFIVFITIKGELVQYLDVVGLAGGATTRGTGTGAGNTGR